MELRRLLCSVAACVAWCSSAQAATAWDEAVSGDLANVGTTPTVLSFGLGSNVVRAASGNPGAGVDRDYFSFTVPTGWELTELNVLPGTQGLGSGEFIFIGLQAGGQVTVDPTGGTAAGLLGWDLFGAGNIGSNLLPSMSVASVGSTGFTPPLGAGTYAVWVQELGSGVAPYVLDFVVAEVPEPAAAWLLAAGLAGLGARRLRRR